MINFKETSRSIFGAWMLARFDADGLLLFENTVSAFWRSYWSAIFALPAYIALVMMRTPETMITVGALPALIIQTSGYVVGWFAMPFVMLSVCRIIDREDQFCRYFAAYNWAALLQITLMLALTTLAKTGMLPPAFAGIVSVIAIIAILIYQGYIARVALMIPSMGALGVVLLDLMLGLVVESWTTKLLAGHRLFGG
ncbi:MAG: hypothetical protein GKS01_00980 [Alphaproteobacteria bacterium]|nr:hypothetical protein [Alphaproteobacteria bacterium]